MSIPNAPLNKIYLQKLNVGADLLVNKIHFPDRFYSKIGSLGKRVQVLFMTNTY